MKTETQREQILRDLLTGARITALDALTRYKCNRLASRVFELKRDGFNIHSEMISVDSGKKVAQYYIPEEPKAKQGADFVANNPAFI